MSNIFSIWGRKFYESGYSVMPVIAKNQPIESGFQRFSKALPTEDEFQRWESLNNSFNIGLVLGLNNLVCLDIDYDGEDRDAFLDGVKALCPPIVVAKKGKKGLSIFFRGKMSGKKMTHSSYGKKPLVEVLSVGNYTILPPSIHVDTKKPYSWEGQTDLLNVTPEDLPWLTDADVLNIEIFISDFMREDEQTRGGRNISLGAYIFKIAPSCKSTTEVVEKVIAKDLEWNGKDSYYNDRSESKGMDPILFATKHVERAVSWLIKKKKEKGIDWSFEGQHSVDEIFYPKDIDKIKMRHQNFAQGFCFVDKSEKKEKIVPLYRSFSAYFMDVEGFKIFNNEYCYFHNGQYYQLIKSNQVKKIVSERVAPELSSNQIEQFYKRLIIDGQVLGEQPKGNFGFINLNNGVYEIDKNILHPHSKKHFFTNKINIDYKDGDCPNFKNFLNDVFESNKELVLAAQKIFGYCLVGGAPILHKAFCLVGSGRNGKGVFLDALKLILEGSYSVVSLANIDNPFSMVSLDGSLANITEESPREINSELFKTIVAGGEVQAGQKHLAEYRFRVNARFIFACNDFPYFDDKNISMNDRLFIIPFNKTYSEEVRDTELFDKKIRPEASGILNWAIEGARMYLADKKILQPQISMEMKNEYREESDLVYSWFKESIKIEGIATEKFWTVNDLYTNYKNWATFSGQTIIGANSFAKRLKRLVKEQSNGFLDQTRQDVDGRKMRGYFKLTILATHKKPDEFQIKAKFRPGDQHLDQ